ncbi:MAG: 50S ribosomal protein L25 [Anaerolineaceae bacterium]|nr:50S ribosomal protein L25 [Anaerolineaceae bacterium]
MSSKKEEVVISAEKRSVIGKQVAQLRRSGKLPGVIYGRHLEAFPIQMNAHEAGLKLGKLTGSSVITIDVDGEKHKAIIRDLQRDVIFGRPLHVDFLAISMKEKLRAAIDLVLTGEAPVLKLGEYLINQGVERIEIEALPSDLPERIEVDLSALASPEDSITIADLNLGSKITVLTEASEVIVSVGRPAVEAESEAEESGVEPEVLEKGKKEEDAE